MISSFLCEEHYRGSSPSLYIDNVLQRQICCQDVLVRSLAMQRRTKGILPTLTVHPGLLQFLSK
ncbi:hypothetical protein E2C01_057528 [Portunus trituberculatus]|uniref:Uncharacterized protein n=1 Tax=Portunus trituberculatus TaxID=210409 RepID=A0A5B7GTR7_PORTR|nr:hypothetical protein [Portunus trituberculatus]